MLYEVITDKMPKLAVIQSEGCAPMAAAWRFKLEKADPVTPHKGIPVNGSLRARSEVGVSEGDLAVTAIQGLGRSSEPVITSYSIHYTKLYE